MNLLTLMTILTLRTFNDAKRRKRIRWEEEMQYSVKDLKGYAIGAMDGDIGKVDDFYLDDESWTIRYLVAETGNWLLN